MVNGITMKHTVLLYICSIFSIYSSTLGFKIWVSRLGLMILSGFNKMKLRKVTSSMYKKLFVHITLFFYYHTHYIKSHDGVVLFINVPTPLRIEIV